jgi:hypothetical protein
MYTDGAAILTSFATARSENGSSGPIVDNTLIAAATISSRKCSPSPRAFRALGASSLRSVFELILFSVPAATLQHPAQGFTLVTLPS